MSKTGVPCIKSIPEIVIVRSSNFSSLAIESPMGLYLCGDLVANTPFFAPSSLGGCIFVFLGL